MAEGYIGETTCSTYIRQRLHYITTKTATGHNVKVELQMRRTNSYGGATFQYPSNSYIEIDEDREDWSWNQNNYPSIPANNTNWLVFASREIHVAHTDAITIGIAGGNYNMGSYLNGDTSGDIDLEAIVVAPTTPTISVVNNAYNKNTITYGTTSFGLPNSGTVKLFGGTASSPTTQLASKTTTGNSAYAHNSLTGNKRYYYRAKATNGSADSAYSTTVSVYMPCPPLSALSLSSQVYTTYDKVKATFSYTRQSDGGAQTRTGEYRYSTDNKQTFSDWTSFGTVSDTTSTFEIPNLPTSKTVVVQVKLTTPDGGDSEIKECSFSSKTTHTAPNFSNFAYEDNNAAAVAVSGNNQVFIQGQSQPKITISAANKAIANDGASITGYTASLNAQSIQIPYSASAAVSGTFSTGTPTASGTLALTVAANDSLSLAKSVSKNVPVIPHAAPVLNASAVRLNNFENQTTLSIAGTYSQILVDNVVKNTLAVKYRFKKASASSWDTSTEGADEDGWIDRPITITDEDFAATDLILSFDNEYAWDIEVKAVDAFDTTTVALSLSIGKSIFRIGVDGHVYNNEQPLMPSHVGQVIMSTTLDTAAKVREIYGGYWTSYSGISVPGLYCWRRTS